jgi:putative nucleotidyltransferase with HDIG domain
MNEATMSPSQNDALYNLKLIASKTGDLPPMPAVAMKALDMTKDLNITARELQTVITQDQALTARILKIVNSAMYSLRREVSTVSHAVAVMGLQTIRSVIMAACVQQVFKTGSNRSQDLGGKLLSEHSWGAAIAARLIAQRVRYPNPEEAFLCGLMHDIGKPVMLKNLQAQYMPILNEVYRGQTNFYDAELKAFGFSHAHVGALLGAKWNFPPQLPEAIGFHHDPTSAPNHARLACTISLANSLMVSIGIGFEKTTAMELHLMPAAQFLKVNKPALDSLALEVKKAMSEMPSILET